MLLIVKSKISYLFYTKICNYQSGGDCNFITLLIKNVYENVWARKYNLVLIMFKFLLEK